VALSSETVMVGLPSATLTTLRDTRAALPMATVVIQMTTVPARHVPITEESKPGMKRYY